MTSRNIPEGKPDYTLGFRIRTVVILTTVFGGSLAAAICLGNLSFSLYGTNSSGRILLPFDMKGLLNALYLASSFSASLSGIIGLLVVLSYFRTGQFHFYEDHTVWKRPGKMRILDYSELEDAYFGYEAMNKSAQPLNYNAPKNYMFVRVVSFYIGNRRLNFSVGKHSGVLHFLEERIPREKIDVMEDSLPETE